MLIYRNQTAGQKSRVYYDALRCMTAFIMGARRSFPAGGGTAWTNKNGPFFGAPGARTKLFAIFRRFKLELRAFDASAEGAYEI